MSHTTPYQFALFRICLGLYLVVHLVYLVPYAPEMFSNAGMLADASINLSYGYFPNPLNVIDSPLATQAFLAVLVGLALMLTFGIKRRWVVLLLWFGWACLLNRNVLIRNPSMPFVGWMLLSMSLVPEGEGLSWRRMAADPAWRLPGKIFVALWILMAVGYSLSGLDKALSPSWQDGSALSHVLGNPLSRDNGLVRLMLAQPEFLRYSTWGALALEIVFLPLSLWSRSRPWIWLAMVGMQVGILFLVDFADLTFGVLMLHSMTFDARWLAAAKDRSEPPILFFDGVCGLCNGSIDLLVTEDQSRVLRYAPLQGETAKAHLTAQQIEDLDTFYLWEDGKLLERSDAWIRVGVLVGGMWKLAWFLAAVPRPIRDGLYRLVARHRYRLFGKRAACRLPTADERPLFLD